MLIGYVYEVWPGTQLIKSWTWYDDEAGVPEAWFFMPIEEGPPIPVDSPAQVEAAAFALLDSKQRVAVLQISALQSRVDSINYLINTGNPDHPDYLEPDDPDYLEPTPEELAELPVRKVQLKSWNTYRGKLGRVTTSPGWYQTPAWPAAPAPYTSEMSASTPETA
jgi:hypothetical protein